MRARVAACPTHNFRLLCSRLRGNAESRGIILVQTRRWWEVAKAEGWIAQSLARDQSDDDVDDVDDGDEDVGDDDDDVSGADG